MRMVFGFGVLTALLAAGSAQAASGWICQLQLKSGRNPTYAETLYKYELAGDNLQLIEDGGEQGRVVQTSYRVVENDAFALTAINATASMNEAPLEGGPTPTMRGTPLADVVSLNKRSGVLTRAVILADEKNLESQRGNCRGY